jgi:hypothetical protein
MVEDFLPLDPREYVRFRAGSGSDSWDFRVHPGALESPLQTLQSIVNYADAIDPVLADHLGFGVADALQLASRMLDAELSILAPAWDDRQVSDESPPRVTEAEVAAAAAYLDQWRPDGVVPAWLSEIRDNMGRARFDRMAETLTVGYQHLSFDAGPSRVFVGPALLVRGREGILPVPCALIIESLTSVVTHMLRFSPGSSESAKDGLEPGKSPEDSPPEEPQVTAAEAEQAARRWRERAEADLEWACRALPAGILFGQLTDDGHDLLLIAPGHRHVVAVELVTGLTSQGISEGVRAAQARLARFGPGSRFRVTPPSGDSVRQGPGTADRPPPAGTTDSDRAWLAGIADAMPFAESLMSGEDTELASGTVVTRIVVVDGPWQRGPLWAPGMPVCTLAEFRSLLGTQDWESTDREELWSFLDELTSLGADAAGNGWAELVCWSILDAWSAWQANGMLCPAWIPPGTPASVLPRDLVPSWERCGVLDPADAILASFGMAQAREWSQLIPNLVPAAVPGSADLVILVTLSLYEPRRIWWVAPDMGLLVAADLQFHDGLMFNREAMSTLANVVEETLRELARDQPHAWQRWRQAHGDHPVALHVVPARMAEDSPAVRFVARGSRFAVICVDPQQLPGLPPAEVHDMIGDALMYSMLAHLQPLPDPGESPGPDQGSRRTGEAAAGQDPDHESPTGRVLESQPSEDDIEQARMFRAAWHSIPPRLTQYSGAAPFAPHELSAAQTLTEGGKTRGWRAISRQLRSHLNAGTHPLKVVLSELCPAALGRISDAAGSYAPRAALAAACGELERALSDRFSARMSQELNLSSTWADETLADLDIIPASDDTRRVRITDLLIEQLLSLPPSGSLVPDRRDIHQLLDLAAAALDASLDAQYAYAAIRPAVLEVSEFGDIDIVQPGPAHASIQAWQQARLEDQARAFTARTGSPDPVEDPKMADPGGHDQGEADQRETLRSILEQTASESSGFEAANANGLLNVDDQLITHRGFGLDSIRAVLAMVTSWDIPAEPYPAIASISRARFVDEVAAWSGLLRDQIDAAVTECTLSGDRINHEGLRYWQLRERSARLALRPLIAPPDTQDADELWLLPRCAHRTQHLLLSYLSEQQLPWPERDLPEPVRKAVRDWHKLAEDHLESELSAVAESTGLACRLNLKENKASLEGLTLHGEIDLVAADPVRRRIWIMEAKHLRQVFSPLEMGFRIADFQGAAALAIGPDTNEFRQFQSSKFRPYTQRVLENAGDVRRNKQSAIRLIAATAPESDLTENTADDWDVIPLIVTSHVELPAFVPDPKTTFVLIDHLRELLSSEKRPSPGWWSPWSD